MSDYKGKMPTRSEGIYEVAINEEPASSAIVASERSGTIGVETLSKRPTAKNGDEDKIALDVALSDGNVDEEDSKVATTPTFFHR